MPVLRMLPGGATLHTPPARIVPPTAKRGNVATWSSQTSGRNRAWLRSTPPEGYDDGQAFAATFTYAACPASHDVLQRDRERLLERLRRAGALRWHWVVEFTRRGWPHLHLAIWMPHGYADGCARLADHWLAITAGRGTLRGMQPVQPMYDAAGWARYVSKHVGRGSEHYQRRRMDLPPGWDRTGRLWGYGGDWRGRAEPTDTLLADAAGYALRRIHRKLETARARLRLERARTPPGGPTAANAKALRKARRAVQAAHRMLRAPTAAAGRVRGLSLWAGPGEQRELLRAIGHDPRDRAELAAAASRDRRSLRDALRALTPS